MMLTEVSVLNLKLQMKELSPPGLVVSILCQAEIPASGHQSKGNLVLPHNAL